MKSSKREIFLFLVNGTIGYIFFASVIEILYSITVLNHTLASALSFLVAACVSYLLHAFVTFGVAEKHHLRMPRFLIIQAFGASLSAITIPFLVSTLVLQPWVAATIFALGWPFISFPTMKYWVFQ